MEPETAMSDAPANTVESEAQAGEAAAAPAEGESAKLSQNPAQQAHQNHQKGRSDRRREQAAPTAKIEELLKEGQEVVVQVVKEPLGTKGARLTNFITIPGRYAVLMPTVETLGVSRKIESQQERDRLKKILQQVRAKGVGLITPHD